MIIEKKEFNSLSQLDRIEYLSKFNSLRIFNLINWGFLFTIVLSIGIVKYIFQKILLTIFLFYWGFITIKKYNEAGRKLNREYFEVKKKK